MRNLKKILALVLALVMSFSLMATANAFTDDEKITDTYETAVTVLSGLKVFQGYDDGTFQPQGPITRAEVAAIIYRIVTGDVADTQVGIYADYNKFNDVKSTSWYAGYVNFCANAEYIKGYDAKTFGPNDPVTGYQALAMILRALGYDKNGEFTGTSWQVQTAAVGENRGITKNISAGTLGTAATREVVAEILFRAILVEKVNYTPAFGYQLDDTSIGWDTFELEEISGIVVANEYADLYSTTSLKAGKTELDVDGDSYVLDYATTLEDIGEARDAYVTEGKTVLYIADAGNTVFETGAETDIESKKDFEDVTGMERGDATEYFINFDGGNEYKASDWKIKYVIETNTGDSDEASLAGFIKENGLELKTSDFKYEQDGNWSYTKTIKPGATITDADLTNIKAIFDAADADSDLIIGAVYVGTQSNEDISDELSYKQFVDKYIDTDENAIEVEGNENGEWLKVIDNDGDGVADIVLLTKYVMAAITDIDKNGDYTVSYDVSGDLVEIDSADMMTEDELAEDDIIVYAYIDGNYVSNIADMVTETIDKKGIDFKAETITCGDNTYAQSGIGVDQAELNAAFLYDHFEIYVTDAETEVAYDLYLDNFGFVRAFTENKYAYGLGLLTDGYYETNKKVETIQVDMNTVDTDETTYDVDADSDWDLFVDDSEGGDSGNRGTWGRLEGFQGNYANAHQFATNVAAFSNSDDVLSLYEVNEYTNKELVTLKNELVLTAKSDLEDKELTAYFNDKAIDQHTVYATTDTVYYYVNFDKDGDPYVEATWTGYNNAPSNLSLDADVDYAYAVYTETKVGSGYYYADVIVIEAESSLTEANFIWYANTKSGTGESYWVKTIDQDEDGAWDPESVINTAKGVVGIPMFYVVNADSDLVSPIWTNYAKWDIYASTVTVARDVSGRNYVYMADGTSFVTEETPVYALSFDNEIGNRWVAYSITDDVDVDQNDMLIYVTDGDGNVEYAIDVTVSTYKVAGVTYIVPNLADLWYDIATDYVPTDLEKAIAAANDIDAVAAMGATPAAGETAWGTAVSTYNALKALINNDLSKADYDKAMTALNALGAKILTAAKADAKAAIQAEYDKLAPSYTENATALSNAKDAADAKVDAWTIDKVIPTYTAPAIDVDGIDTDATELAAAKAAAEKAVKEAYEAAVALSKEYDPSLASAILNEYNLAQNAIAEAEADKDVDAMKAIDGAEITAIVADCQAVDTAAAVAKALQKQNVNFVTNESTTTGLIKTSIENELKKHGDLMKDGNLIVTVTVSTITTKWGDLSVATPSKDETLTWTISVGDIKATGKINVTVTAASAKKVADAKAVVEAADKAAAGKFFSYDPAESNPGAAAVAAAQDLDIDVNVAFGNTANPEKGVHTVELTLSKGSSFSATVTVTGTCENHAACNP